MAPHQRRRPDDYVIKSFSGSDVQGETGQVWRLFGPELPPEGEAFFDYASAEMKGRERARSRGVTLWLYPKPHSEGGELVESFRK